MKQTKCKKCGNDSYFTQVKGNNMGAYCCKCGAWIKWLSKEERALHELVDITENIGKKRQCTSHSPNCKLDDNNYEMILQRLDRFVDALDEAIDSVYEHPTCNHDKMIYNNTYAYALEKCKISIQNIVDGREYNDIGVDQ